MTEKNYGFDPKKLRMNCFLQKNYDLDHDLIKLISSFKISEPEKMGSYHDLLLNPLTHYLHIYIVEYLKEFIQYWFKKENVKILDWGCGRGHITYLCKKRSMNITACDVAEATERERGDSAFFQYTPIINSQGIDVIPLKESIELPFAEKEFDVVLSVGVLEHVQNDAESLKEIYRVLKHNGLFFCFFLPKKHSWRQKLQHLKGDYYHDRFYSKKLVEELVGSAGMEMIDYWVRDVIPFRSHNPWYRLSEKIDNWFCSYTLIKFFASNIEFVAKKTE